MLIYLERGGRMKFKLLTKWKDKELICCCPSSNKCSKDHGCEELDFILNPYDGIEECMREHSYERSKGGAIHQKR